MCGKWSPHQFVSGTAFRFPMRRELGSKSARCRLEITCYRRPIFSSKFEIFGFNDLLTSCLLLITVELSHRFPCLELGKYSASGTARPGFTVQRSVYMAAMRWRQERSGGKLTRADAIPPRGRPWPIASRDIAECDELATEPRAFNLASCCTCAPAMLAKPRF